MKTFLSILAIMSIALTSVVQAHTHLKSSQPADNSTLSRLPTDVVLEFSEAVQVTSLTLQKNDEDARDLGPLPNAAATRVTVPMPTVAAGEYAVKWRAVGEDNHLVSGEFLFTYKAK